MFPFMYRGVTYTECTVVNSIDTWKPWCALKTGNYDLHGQWGYCDCNGKTKETSLLQTVHYTCFYPPIGDTTGKLDARCEMYKGGDVCAPYRRGRNVFVDVRYNQSYLGRVAIDPINSSLWGPTEDNLECRSLSLETICYMVFPNCIERIADGGIFPIPFCKETCTDLISKSSHCSKAIINLFNIFTSVFFQSMLNPVHVYVAVPECDSLQPQKQSGGLCVQHSASKTILRLKFHSFRMIFCQVSRPLLIQIRHPVHLPTSSLSWFPR